MRFKVKDKVTVRVILGLGRLGLPVQCCRIIGYIAKFAKPSPIFWSIALVIFLIYSF